MDEARPGRAWVLATVVQDTGDVGGRLVPGRGNAVYGQPSLKSSSQAREVESVVCTIFRVDLHVSPLLPH
jgi:hypothetical protein